MKTINIIAITLSLLAFAACDTTRDTLPDVSEGSIPVGFSSTVPKMRAPGYDTNNLLVTDTSLLTVRWLISLRMQ